ncbi:ensconsin isoform X1 [Nelusetta ayraudi]|uniref:ensconsin isoform X1 n=1 Tax=Nelusetta ayraudi TaxID=303726 RepID=UPI003F71B857
MADLDGSDASPPESQASYSHYKSEDGRASSATRPSSGASMQTYTVAGGTTTSNSPSAYLANKPDSLLFNKNDERQRMARERRVEREKQNAVKEAQWQAREERARQFYERQIEEKKKKLEEQRVKEDRRRAAVEEKRRQKLEEDKVRHEAVMRRTVERSQRTRQKTNRWSWGGALNANTPSAPTDADRRSVSTTNLSKHTDPVITKRLSSSSATLLHSPDRGLQMRTASSPVISKAQSKPRLHKGKSSPRQNTGLRRLPLTPWESNVVNRLQQPTHSYLARSRSAMSLSGEQAVPTPAMPVCPRSVSCHPMGSMSFKALQALPLPHCRSHERNLSREAASSKTVVRRRTAGAAPVGRLVGLESGHRSVTQVKDRDGVRKSWSNLSLPLTPLLTLPLSKHSSSASKKTSRATAPSIGRPPQRPSGRPPTPKRLKSPGPEDPGNLRPIRITPESPQSVRAQCEEEEEGEDGKVEEEEEGGEEGGEEVLSPSLPRPQPVGQNKPSNEPSPAGAREGVSSPPPSKPSAGTTDREEASRILAENRRLAREQREREEEQRRQQEEQARLAREEMARRKAEERAKREEEAQRQAEERKSREEEERKKEEEERIQRESEEAERLQKQKEEEESRQREEAERVKQERDKHFQKEEAERMERKKRLEEIMKRTRRSDTAEKKVVPNRSDDDAATLSPSATVPLTNSSGSDDNGRPLEPSLNPDQRENGEFEEVIVLPSHSRLSPPEGQEQQQQTREQEERAPLVAFRENGLLKPVSGVEDLSAQQGADVA